MAKIQIRQGVFETNSSSTHSITMCDAVMFRKWTRGELYMNLNEEGDKQFLLVDVAKKWNKDFILNNPDKTTYFDRFKKEDDDDEYDGDYEIDELGYVIDSEYAEHCYISYNQWCDMHTYYDIYSADYETKSGDKITAFGYYGHD